MVSVIYYAHRAFLIGWLVIEGEKGHFPTQTHPTLVREVKALILATSTVAFLGDREFDSPELQAELAEYGWDYACRTSKNIQINVDEQCLSWADLPVKRGERVFRKGALFTHAAYGPVMVIAWWGARHRRSPGSQTISPSARRDILLPG